MPAQYTVTVELLQYNFSSRGTILIANQSHTIQATIELPSPFATSDSMECQIIQRVDTTIVYLAPSSFTTVYSARNCGIRLVKFFRITLCLLQHPNGQAHMGPT